MGKYSDELDRQMEENQKKVQEANQKAIEEAQKQALAYQQQIMEMQKQAAAAGGMTPEMMMQMQQQAMQMQQQMMGTLGGYGGEDDEDEEDEEMEDNEEAKAEFAASHPQPEGMSKYLAPGSFFVAMRDEPLDTLEMMYDADDYKEDMDDSWNVDDRESLTEMIESLLGGRAYNVYNDTYLAIKSGQTDEVSEDDMGDYETTVEALKAVLEISQEEIDKCPSIIAWDIERAAYLARAGAHVGYITQEEAWGYLKRAAALVKENFTDWTQYAVSVVMGRALHMGYTEMYFYPTAELLRVSPEFLEERPVKSL